MGHTPSGTAQRASKSMRSKGTQRPPHNADVPPTPRCTARCLATWYGSCDAESPSASARWSRLSPPLSATSTRWPASASSSAATMRIGPAPMTTTSALRTSRGLRGSPDLRIEGDAVRNDEGPQRLDRLGRAGHVEHARRVLQAVDAYRPVQHGAAVVGRERVGQQQRREFLLGPSVEAQRLGPQAAQLRVAQQPLADYPERLAEHAEAQVRLRARPACK